ncbi:MAG TPA: hypothetical protein P5290_07930 [Candidatus Methanomethylicus sp.]|nr:hypothetical protein [Candidatus Methanomethylicus sp.]
METEKPMAKGSRVWLLLAALVTVAAVAALAAANMMWFMLSPRAMPFPFEIPWDLELFYMAKTVASSINIALLIFLLAIYVGIYRKTRAEFTLGLIVFALVLMMNALASNTFVIFAFGFRLVGLGPFALLPDLFTLVALMVLTYFAVKY